MSKQVYSSSAAFLTSHLNIDVSEAEPLRFGKRYPHSCWQNMPYIQVLFGKTCTKCPKMY